MNFSGWKESTGKFDYSNNWCRDGPDSHQRHYHSGPRALQEPASQAAPKSEARLNSRAIWERAGRPGAPSQSRGGRGGGRRSRGFSGRRHRDTLPPSLIMTSWNHFIYDKISIGFQICCLLHFKVVISVHDLWSFISINFLICISSTLIRSFSTQQNPKQVF